MSAYPIGNKSAQSLNRLLAGASGELKYLVEHGNCLKRVAHLVQDQLPAPLRQHCRVADINQQTLFMHTDSPAWGTRLRYHCPQILAHLRRHAGLDHLLDVRIKSVPQISGQSPALCPARTLSADAAVLLRQVADSVSAPALKQALLRLALRAEDHPAK